MTQEVNKANSQVDSEQSNLVELPDGTKVTVDELLSGYMRQSDYTKKTQALADEKKALESTKVNQQVDSTLNSNPEKSNEAEVTKMFLDMKMDQLRNKYGESFDEVAVLRKAAQMLENGMKPTNIDFDFIARGLLNNNDNAADLEAKIRQKVLAEMSQSGVDTSSIISGNGSGDINIDDGTYGLTPEELDYCRKTGEDPKIYAEWKEKLGR